MVHATHRYPSSTVGACLAPTPTSMNLRRGAATVMLGGGGGPQVIQGALSEDTEARHLSKVSRIARQLRQHDARRPLSLKKRAVSHVVPKRNDRRRSDEKLDVS